MACIKLGFWSRIGLGFVFVLILAAVIGGIVAAVLRSRDADLTDQPNHVTDEKLGELLLVQMIFRHGARTALFDIPNDPYQNYSWSEGAGGLTVKGKERMYYYGQVARRRFKSYLGKKNNIF